MPAGDIGKMRFNPLVKKIFSDDLIEVEIVTEQELERSIKTKKLLVDVKTITKAFQFFAGKGHEEGACLLRGKISGEYLLVTDVFCCSNAKGTPTHVVMNPDNFSQASSIDDGNYVIGWGHSHPGFQVFMSGTDKTTQKDFQAMFPDAIALVMNPFAKHGIDFKFFRYEDGHLEKIKYDYLVSRDEN